MTSSQRAANETHRWNAELDGLHQQVATAQQSLTDSEVGDGPVLRCCSTLPGKGCAFGICQLCSNTVGDSCAVQVLEGPFEHAAKLLYTVAICLTPKARKSG